MDPEDSKTKKAYRPFLTGKLAQFQGQKAATNAESYAWFATAMYLNRNYWSRVIGGKRVSGPATRRFALVIDGNGLWRTFLTDKAENETINTEGMRMGEDDKSDFLWDS